MPLSDAETIMRAWTRAVRRVSAKAERSAGDSAKMAHALRLTVKNLRAYLQLLRPLFSESDRRELNGFLRDTAQALAAGRAAEVLGKLVAERSGEDAGPESAAISVVSKRVERNRKSVSDSRLRMALARLEATVPWLRRLLREASAENLIRPGRKRIFVRAQTFFGDWKKEGDIASAHACRRFTKYLMFACEVPKANEGMTLAARRLDQLQKELGDLNDLGDLESELVRLKKKAKKSGMTASLKAARSRLRKDRKKKSKELLAAAEDVFGHPYESLENSALKGAASDRN